MHSNSKNRNIFESSQILSNSFMQPEARNIESSNKKAKQKFSEEEDLRLASIVDEIGCDDWVQVSAMMGTRNSRQCRERWTNYLDPNLKNEQWTEAEDALLNQKLSEFGQKWHKIAKFFPNRSANNIRNRCFYMKRHLQRQHEVLCSPSGYLYMKKMLKHLTPSQPHTPIEVVEKKPAPEPVIEVQEPAQLGKFDDPFSFLTDNLFIPTFEESFVGGWFV